MEKKEKMGGKENRKIIDHMIKKVRNFRAVSQCFLAMLNESGQSWFKVPTAQHVVE